MNRLGDDKRDVISTDRYHKDCQTDASKNAVGAYLSVSPLNSRGLSMKLLWIATLTLLPACLSAHEFWIQPLNYSVGAGAPIQASLNAGERFSGTAYPFRYARTISAKLTDQSGETRISGVDGAQPALQTTTAGNGLQILSYQSAPSHLQHSDFDKFRSYLIEDGITWVEQAHRQRGLPSTGFTEAFSRYAKSLIKAGDGQGSDKHTGMPYEWIALNNPYRDELSANAAGVPAMLARLQAHGEAVPDAQVTIFHDNGADPVRRSITHTNSDGIAEIPVYDGGEFLISSVIMTQGERAAWHSRWVSMTWQIE